MDVLREMTKLNRNNGRRFAMTYRADAIQELLASSEYRLLSQYGLDTLYGLCPLHELNSPIWIVISHIACVSTIKDYFVKELSN